MVIYKKHMKIARLLSDTSAIMTTTAYPLKQTGVSYSLWVSVNQHGGINPNTTVILMIVLTQACSHSPVIKYLVIKS